MSEGHIPVLAETLEELVSLPRDGVVIDATVGFGGHSRVFANSLGKDGVIVGFDVDAKSLARAEQVLSDVECEVILKRENFADIAGNLGDIGIDKCDLLLADLGWCSGQIVDSERGMSFQQNMPLDMRLDERLKKTAADIVNDAGEEDLADIIYKFGDEHRSRRIARFIVEFRSKQPIRTTGQLASLICKSLGKSPIPGKIHPATKTFQALRIAVNDELGNLKKLVGFAPDIVKSGGYVAVISFHSLEDRIVKEDFKLRGKEGVYNLITKKPVVADREETRENPGARSAKLRIAQRT